jgi:hypothetical protein
MRICSRVTIRTNQNQTADLPMPHHEQHYLSSTDNEVEKWMLALS